MGIICTGQCTYDLTFPVQGLLIENQKYRAMEPFSCIDAPAANVVHLCTLWNAETALISGCGKGSYGVKIRGALKEAGADTACPMKDESFSTPVSAIITNSFNGYRTIFNCLGTQRKLEFHYPEQAEILLLDSHKLQTSLEILGRYSDVDSIMDVGTFHEETNILVQEVTYLVCSRGYARQFSNIKVSVQGGNSWRQAFDALYVLNAGRIVVTLGDQGLLYEDTWGIHHIEVFSVSAVGTTETSDIFHGASTHCVHKSYSLQDILIVVPATSAISMQTLGGQTSIPIKAAANRFLNGQCCHLILE